MKPLALVAAGLVAAITGVWWTVAPIVGGIILWLIRERGPADPAPVSQLRRRQLDAVVTNQRVER